MRHNGRRVLLIITARENTSLDDVGGDVDLRPPLTSCERGMSIRLRRSEVLSRDCVHSLGCADLFQYCIQYREIGPVIDGNLRHVGEIGALVIPIGGIVELGSLQAAIDAPASGISL